MGDAAEDNQSGGGDAEEKGPEPIPEPEPPKVPDVELVVDGFGFMPKEMNYGERRRSSVYTKTKLGPKKDSRVLKTNPEEEQTPCASSTNIDVVRRYTWKTRNRMTVQVKNRSTDCLNQILQLNGPPARQ